MAEVDAGQSGSSETYRDGGHTVGVGAAGLPGVRRFTLHSDAPRVDGLHTHGGTRQVDERSTDPYADTGSALLDGLFAMAVAEAHENAVAAVCDGAFNHGRPIPLAAYETGAKWHYVWTRDLSYAVDLGLAGLDPARCAASLLFKTSGPRPGVGGPYPNQVLQDTGSGGSYPVSSDRAVWAIAADRIARHLSGEPRGEFVRTAYAFLRDTAEQDRRLVYDPADGLYRGEQSFLDWREQTYPLWTADDTLAIALSKATGTNVGHVALLATAAAFAAELGDGAAAEKYGRWAEGLRASINAQLWDADAGLYAAYLLTESRWAVRVKRYDLLSQALAIEWGVADAASTRRIIGSYPSGPHGPPVVWPQEQAVPIYHNHAMWPFVTAYWARAAAGMGHGPAVGLALHSLVRGAAVNLSNMENMDLVTGQVQATVHGISGPVISSQRQLWSVAGFVSVVRDVIFGVAVDRDGRVNVRPCLTPAVRRRYLGGGETVALRNLAHRGKRVDVVLHLPNDDGGPADVPYAVGRATHNGEPCDGGPVACRSDVNRWELWLVPGTAAAAAEPVRLVTDFDDVRQYFGPRQVEWAGDGVTVGADGRATLRFASAGPGAVTYDVFRDGRCVAAGLASGEWTDDAAGPHTYAVAATFAGTGLQSHLSAERSTAAVVERAIDVELDGERTIVLGETAGGEAVVRLRYANRSAPINTGITCCVKRWEIVPAGGGGDGAAVAGGYVLMPQTVPGRTALSSPMVATLAAGVAYALRVDEDAASRNMSYLEHNRLYTAHSGGGNGGPVNTATVSGVVVASA